MSSTPVFDACAAFHDGIAVVRQSQSYGCIDQKGQFLVPFQPHLLFDFRDGRAPIDIGGKWGFIDSTGNVVIPALSGGVSIHPCAVGFHEGLAAVEYPSGVGYVNRAGELVIAPRPTGINEFTRQIDGFVLSEARAAFPIMGSWGYLGSRGAFVIRPAFEGIGAFSEGLAAAYSEGLWKYIRPDGRSTFTVPDQARGKRSFLGGPCTIRVDSMAQDAWVPCHEIF